MFALGNAPKIRQYHLARFYVGERLVVVRSAIVRWTGVDC